MINYDNKTFRSIENTENGEVSGETTFHYRQKGNIVTATYSGGGIIEGHLIALISENGDLSMRYHHVNAQNVLMTGVCRSIPEILSNGKIRLHELWQWTSGDESTGRSIVEEI
ncbi:hypothetical protein [Pinibacter soli]|uniref:N-acetylglutamate synthase n=1 Tax=Pinibacter soli TaxID=3044211 RepID=A0ABT6RG64_9BACT|nr:hypothetical protein [Pinibacter soli]MDI3321566.1 hypothetical protein [Pinibacter soli]